MKTSFWTRIFDLIAPRPCAICGRRLSVNESLLCAVCHLHLPFTHYEKDPTDNPVARLFWGHFPVERAVALVYFIPKSEAGEIIYDMKYRGQADIGYYLGTIMAKQLAEQRFFDGIDALIPMPITRKRRWQRGYNQCEVMARGISSMTGIPIYNKVVRRIHFVKSQTQQRGWERAENVDGAFALNDGDKIKGKHLLIVDDIITTGATVCALASSLCQVEGVKISVLSFGYTKS